MAERPRELGDFKGVAGWFRVGHFEAKFQTEDSVARQPLLVFESVPIC